MNETTTSLAVLGVVLLVALAGVLSVNLPGNDATGLASQPACPAGAIVNSQGRCQCPLAGQVVQNAQCVQLSAPASAFSAARRCTSTGGSFSNNKCICPAAKTPVVSQGATICAARRR